MAVTVGVYNHTTKLFLNQEIDLANCRFELLNNSAAFSAAHVTKDQVNNGSAATVTMTIASPAVITHTAHGKSNGQIVQLFTTGALPTGFSPGVAYYIVNQSTNTYNLALTAGGAAINTSGSQSGVHTASYMGSYAVHGNGWVPGGPLLTNLAATTITTNDSLLDSDDVVVTASGGTIGPAYKALLYDAKRGRVLKFVDFGEAWQAGDTTDFKLRTLSGLFQLDYT